MPPGLQSTTPLMGTASTPIISDRGDEDLELSSPPRDVTITALSDSVEDGSIAIQISWKSPSPDSVVDLYTVRLRLHLNYTICMCISDC